MKQVLALFYIILAGLSINGTLANVQVKTRFGLCPKKDIGELVLNLASQFKKNQSLRQIKKYLLNASEWDGYLTDYTIEYEPYEKRLVLNFNCAKPILKAQLYRGSKVSSHVISESGELLSTDYWERYRKEHDKGPSLPSIAAPGEFIQEGGMDTVLDIYSSIKTGKALNLAELIVDSERDLTAIFSYKQKPLTVFMGKDAWKTKVEQFNRITNHLAKTTKRPTVLNLRNSKKIVVKFGDSP